MAESDYETLLISSDGQVGQILFNRPERRNALTPQLLDEFNHALLALDRDESVRAIVVSGAGDSFCPGADLRELGTKFDRLIDEDTEVRAWELRTPIIGAINGAAIGVGITLPLQWDIRIAAQDAPISFAFVRRGLVPEAGSHWFLPRLIGASRAMDLLLTGRRITGREAAEIGLVSQALPAEQVLPAAMALAHDIAENCSGLSAAIVKQLLWSHAGDPTPVPGLAYENQLNGWVATQPDLIEGVRAYQEKRPPVWQASKHTPLPARD